MHERLAQRVEQNTKLLEAPAISQTKTTFQLTVAPVEGMFPVSATVAGSTDQSYDVRDEKNLLMAMNVDVSANASVPAALIGATAGQDGMTPLAFKLAADLKTVQHKLFVHVRDGWLSVPGLKKNANISDTVKKTWYGATFDELNTMFGGQSPGKQPVDVERLLRQSFEQQRTVPAAFNTLVQDLHLWKPIETLPKQNGMLRVRVESDRQKLMTSADALAAFMTKINNPVGSATQSQSQLQQMQKKLHDTLTKEGSVIKGILMADEETYDLRGFDGEVVDATGTTLLTLTFVHSNNGDINVQIEDKQKANNNVIFTKKGDAVEMIVDAKKILTGTVTDKKAHLEFFDAAGATQLVSDIDIGKWNSDTLELSGTIMVPSLAVTVNINKLNVNVSNSSKNMMTDLEAVMFFQEKQVATVSMTMARTEKSSLDIKPETSFLPVNALLLDLQPVLQQLQKK